MKAYKEKIAIQRFKITNDINRIEILICMGDGTDEVNWDFIGKNKISYNQINSRKIITNDKVIKK